MLRRWVIRAGWVFVLTVSVWIAFGLLWKDNPATSDRVSGWVAFAALFSDAFRFHLGFPIGAMLLVAMAARGWKLSVALALLLIPTLGARLAMTPDRASGSEKPGQTITVFSANLLYGRGDDERLLEQIFANSPDLVLLQEYTPDEASLAAALRAEYPHSVKHPQNDAFGIALFSRLPFVEEPEVWRGPEESRKPMIACMVEVGGERIAVWNVHTLPPTGGNTTAAQRRMIGWIGEQARVVLNDPGGASGLVIAGDFNATSGSNHLREILAAGLVESHAKAGAGPGVTWPMRGLKRHFGGIRIDHIFVGGILSPASAWVGDDFGSDHLPVVARIVLAN
jgi:endonuclease/exonuclease/phosphatase (EEP) superfamily protein YafD